MKTLEGKVTLITGGTGALGSSVTETLLKEGAKVVATYIDESEINRVSSLKENFNSNIKFIKTDVSDEKQVLKTVDKTIQLFGRIDININLIGGFTYQKILDSNINDVESMFNVNLMTCYICCKSVLGHFVKNNYGKILNIGARPALKSYSGMGPYSISKAGVLRLTETIADEVKEYDINVNAVIPGTIDTPRNRSDMPDANFNNWVKPEDLSKIILFLVSDDSKAINGAIVPTYGKS